MRDSSIRLVDFLPGAKRFGRVLLSSWFRILVIRVILGRGFRRLPPGFVLVPDSVGLLIHSDGSNRFSMGKVFLILFLLIGIVVGASAQSGRRVTSPRSTTVAPIQPPLNPEPEPKPASAVASRSPLLFLSESFREREISALDSGSFRLADFTGKVIVINLWASWCGPCRREVPEYEKVRQAYAGREVEFIGLTTEDPRTSTGRVKKFVRNTDFTFRLGWADVQMARTLMNGRESIPQTLVIDSEGRVVGHWTGYIPRHSGDRLTAAINQALDATP